MEFSTWEYIIPHVGVFVVTSVLSLLTDGYYIIRKVKAKSRKSIILYIPSIMVVIAVLSAFYGLPNLNNWAPLMGVSERAIAVGQVENIKQASLVPFHWDKANGQLTSASYITIEGIDYYSLSSAGINVGDKIKVWYCPDGNAVIKWSFYDGAAPEWPTPNEPDEPDQSQQPSVADNPLLTEEQFVLVFALTMILPLVFSKRFAQWRMSHLIKTEDVTDNLVLPRKLSVNTCMLELLLSLFSVISVFTENVSLIIFFFSATVIFWGIRLSIQKTMVLYQDGQFIFVSALGTHTYQVADVREVWFERTRNDDMQLNIYFKKGQTIKLEQMHFKGLPKFHEWLQKQVSLCEPS